MGAKHTPGPWKQPHRLSRRVLAKVNDEEITIAEVRMLPCLGGPSDVAALQAAEQETANGHLIAAAPELYAACEEARLFLINDLVEPGRTVFWKLVSALAKARGDAEVSVKSQDNAKPE